MMLCKFGFISNKYKLLDWPLSWSGGLLQCTMVVHSSCWQHSQHSLVKWHCHITHSQCWRIVDMSTLTNVWLLQAKQQL